MGARKNGAFSLPAFLGSGRLSRGVRLLDAAIREGRAAVMQRSHPIWELFGEHFFLDL